MNLAPGDWINVVVTAVLLGVCASFIGVIMGVRPSRWIWIFVVTAVLVFALGAVAAYYSTQGAP